MRPGAGEDSGVRGLLKLAQHAGARAAAVMHRAAGCVRRCALKVPSSLLVCAELRTSRRSRVLLVGVQLHHVVASAARHARCAVPPIITLRRRLLTPVWRGCSGLPGFTRSTYQPDHALITPESRVYAPLLGWCARESLAPTHGTPMFTLHLPQAERAGCRAGVAPRNGRSLHHVLAEPRCAPQTGRCMPRGAS